MTFSCLPHKVGSGKTAVGVASAICPAVASTEPAARSVTSRLPWTVVLGHREPMQLVAHCPAEVFVVHTDRGPAVVWVETSWCERPNESACRIAYAEPRTSSNPDRWSKNWANSSSPARP